MYSYTLNKKKRPWKGCCRFYFTIPARMQSPHLSNHIFSRSFEGSLIPHHHQRKIADLLQTHPRTEQKCASFMGCTVRSSSLVTMGQTLFFELGKRSCSDELKHLFSRLRVLSDITKMQRGTSCEKMAETLHSSTQQRHEHELTPFPIPGSFVLPLEKLIALSFVTSSVRSMRVDIALTYVLPALWFFSVVK